MTVRLSSVQLLPPVAVADLRWAFDQAFFKRMTQTALLDELNRRLGAKGIAQVSRSGLNRWVQDVRAGRLQKPPLEPGDGAAVPTMCCPHCGGALELAIVAAAAPGGAT